MKILKNTLIWLLAFGLMACSNDDNDYIDISGDDISIGDDPDGNTSDDEILAQTLNLPSSLFNYANIQLPGHFLDNSRT